MVGFELWISSVWGDHSTNGVTSTIVQIIEYRKWSNDGIIILIIFPSQPAFLQPLIFWALLLLDWGLVAKWA